MANKSSGCGKRLKHSAVRNGRIPARTTTGRTSQKRRKTPWRWQSMTPKLNESSVEKVR